MEIEPDDKEEDKKLWLLVEFATKLIEEYLNRPGLSLKERTEYYNGTGTQKLLLRSRPVYTTPTIQVYVDEGGFFGSLSGSFQSQSQLTYGSDFSLWIDQDNGTSRNGILIRNHAFWPKRFIREAGYLSPFVAPTFGAIKVVYTAGYTIDTLPAEFRMACNLLVAKMRNLLPQATELGSDSYEEASLGYIAPQKGYLMSLVKPFLHNFRNWRF